MPHIVLARRALSGCKWEQTGRMRSRPAAVLAPSMMLALALLAGCSTATTAGDTTASAATSPATTVPPAGRPPAALSPADWTTYHRDAARTGVAPAQPAAGALSIAWRRHLDGAVYGQPLA